MILEVIVSSIYLVNKIFLLLEKKSGWLLGIIASSLACIYFLTIRLFIFMSLEVAVLMIMIFGFLGTKNTKLFTNIVYGVIILVMLYLLFNIEESGILEFITSILFIIAFLALARLKWYWGWSFLGISHLLMLIVTQSKEQYFFAVMQGFSVVVCIVALSRVPKYLKPANTAISK